MVSEIDRLPNGNSGMAITIRPAGKRTSTSEEIAGVKMNQAKGALPEGFFDNKDADLRAHGIKPVKPDIKLALYYFKPHGGFSNSSINLEQNRVWSVCLWQSFKCNKFFSIASYSFPRSPGMKNHPVTTTGVRILQLIDSPTLVNVLCRCFGIYGGMILKCKLENVMPLTQTGIHHINFFFTDSV